MSEKRERANMDDHTPEVDYVCNADVYFGWGWTGCGFGQLSFRYDKETGTFHLMDECMSRERVRKILHAFADHVADKYVEE